MSEFNIDSFALDLMRKVWEIGNGRGPDRQRKAQIQEAIAEAVGPLMAQQAGEPAEYQFYDPVTDRWHGFMNERHRIATEEAGYKIRALYTAPQAQPAPIPTSERLPTRDDADYNDYVWWWCANPAAWELRHYRDGYVQLCQRYYTHWLPTGLTMPPAQGGE